MSSRWTATERSTLPLRTLPSARRAQAGRASAIVALLVIVVLGLVLAFAPRGPGTSATPVAPTPNSASDVRLEALMTHGPEPGRWTRHTLDGTADWVVLEDVEEPDCLLVASVSDDDEIGGVRRWARARAARFFAPGSVALFFRNYERRPRPVVEEDLIHETWVPLSAPEGETARHLWISRQTGEIERLEDRSYLGFCVRSLDRVGPAPDDVAAGPVSSCGARRAPEAPPTPASVAARAPFPLLAPTYLPRGFELVEAGFAEWSLGLSVAEHDADPEALPSLVRMAYLTYSDGLATIALGVSTPDEMDAFEHARARQPHDEDACPPLPETGVPVEEAGRLIRRRHDRCRTVLRLDSEHGVSVSLLARNEFPEKLYVHVLASVVPVAPAGAGDSRAHESRDERDR